MLHRVFSTLAVLSLVPSLLAAQEADPFQGPHILSENLIAFEWGVYCPDVPTGREEAPDVASGAINLYSETPEFRWQQNEVPAAIGIGFGVAIQGDPAALPPTARITMIHPPYPDSGITTETWVSELRTLSPGLNGFSFDFEWEMVLGTWTLRAETDDEVLYEISFEVVPSDRYPEIILTCLGGALS